MKLCYPDTATFYKVTPQSYGNNKTVTDAEEIPVIFLQDTGFTHTNFRDSIDSDAVVYPDFNHSFIIENAMRLEGMYVKCALFGADEDAAWFKIIKSTVNRDHLLNNKIHNIECLLKKTTRLPDVS